MVKESLVDLINSKASYDDLNQLKYEKTNKSDTDMQMKSLDIMHNQMLQLATVLLEMIKNGITHKFETQTEKQ